MASINLINSLLSVKLDDQEQKNVQERPDSASSLSTTTGTIASQNLTRFKACTPSISGLSEEDSTRSVSPLTTFSTHSLNGQLGAISASSGPTQASYLTVCGKELAARYRSGESLHFSGEFFNRPIAPIPIRPPLPWSYQRFQESAMPISPNLYAPAILSPSISPKPSKKAKPKSGAVAAREEVKQLQKYQEKLERVTENILTSAFPLYQNAFLAGQCGEGECPYMILGGVELRDDETLLRNAGTLCAAEPLKDVGQSDKTTGSILFDKKWTIVHNDGAMIGAIHARKTFFIWTNNPDNPMPSDEVLFDHAEGRPRVLGRELLMLRDGGYQRLEHNHQDKLGIALVCTDPQKATHFNFSNLLDVDKVRSIEPIHEFLAQSCITHEHYCDTTARPLPQIDQSEGGACAMRQS